MSSPRAAVRFDVPRHIPPLAQAASLALAVAQYTKSESWGEVAAKIAAEDESTFKALSEVDISTYDSALLDHFDPILRLLRTKPLLTVAVCPVCGPPGPVPVDVLAVGGAPTAGTPGETSASASAVDLANLRAMSRYSGADGGDGADWLDSGPASSGTERIEPDTDALLAALDDLLGPSGGGASDLFAAGSPIQHAPSAPASSFEDGEYTGRGADWPTAESLHCDDGTFRVGTGWVLLSSGTAPTKCQTTWRCPGKPVKGSIAPKYKDD